MESLPNNNLESLLKTQMGYAEFSKCCRICNYHEESKCYLNPVQEIPIDKNACCNFWQEIPPFEDNIDIMKPEEGQIGPDITPECNMLKS